MKQLTTVCLTLCTALVLLSACSPKPPGCGESASQEVLKNLIVGEVRKGLADGSEYKADPQPLDAFLQTLKLAVNMVTTDGYNEASKKHVCHGQLDIVAGNQTGKFDIDYSVQTVEDKHGEFVVRLEQAQFIIDQIKNNALQDWYKNRFSGTWSGIYRCDGIDGAMSGNQAGFQQDTTLIIADYGKAQLERTTRGGGIEKLSGTIDPLGKLELAGIGKNTPDDTWMAYFSGEAKSTELLFNGRISVTGGYRTLRTCQLQLKRTATDFKPVASAASAK